MVTTGAKQLSVGYIKFQPLPTFGRRRLKIARTFFYIALGRENSVVSKRSVHFLDQDLDQRWPNRGSLNATFLTHVVFVYSDIMLGVCNLLCDTQGVCRNLLRGEVRKCFFEISLDNRGEDLFLEINILRAISGTCLLPFPA